MEVVVVIPARYGSTRLEGKVLAKETGKFLVQHTYERAMCARTVEKVLIATDDDKVFQACRSFGAECVMTDPQHQSGTDRIAEAVRGMDFNIVVNLQADEPEIEPEYIDFIAQLLVKNNWADMATLVAEFREQQQVSEPSIVKVVVDTKQRAIYFSRSVIPYDRQAKGVGKLGGYLRHLGIYAYRKDFLLKFTTLRQGALERREGLEQLRVIENGYSIVTGKVEQAWDGIDTPQQYKAFVDRCRLRAEGEL